MSSKLDKLQDELERINGLQADLTILTASKEGHIERIRSPGRTRLSMYLIDKQVSLEDLIEEAKDEAH